MQSDPDVWSPLLVAMTQQIPQRSLMLSVAPVPARLILNHTLRLGLTHALPRIRLHRFHRRKDLFLHPFLRHHFPSGPHYPNNL